MDAESLRAFDNLSAAAGQALWPGTVTIGGTDYACALVRPRQRQVLGDYSEDPEPVQLTVRILKTTLETAPAENSYLTWEGARWKIQSIRGQAASEAQWTLICEPSP